jgi:gamma-glutamyltranspeptidase
MPCCKCCVCICAGEHGKNAFYKGDVASSIAAAAQAAGGVLSESDLEQHTTTFPEPISVDFKGVRAYFL